MPIFPFFNQYGWADWADRPHFAWLWLFILLMTVVLILKGISLWRAARSGQKNWFIALLVINTLGLLEIIYLTFFQKKETTKPARRSKRQSK